MFLNLVTFRVVSAAGGVVEVVEVVIGEAVVVVVAVEAVVVAVAVGAVAVAVAVGAAATVIVGANS